MSTFPVGSDNPHNIYSRDARLRKLRREANEIRAHIRRLTDGRHTLLTANGLQLLGDALTRNIKEQAHLNTLKF